MASGGDRHDTGKALLFLCNRNAIRSPMAEGLALRHFRRQRPVLSAGLDLGAPDPFAIAAMAEIGIDIAQLQQRSIDAIDPAAIGCIISLSPQAHHRASDLARGHMIERRYWPTSDPAEGEGNRDQRMAAYRLVRDALLERIEREFPIAGPGHL